MLGQCWVLWGPSWAYVGLFLPPTETVSGEGFFGAMLGRCWANVGYFGVQVGPVLDYFLGYVGFHGHFWNEKTIEQNRFPCGSSFWGPFWGYMGPSLILSHLGSMLGP